LAAAIFLTINGLILLAGEGLRRRAPVDAHNGDDTEATPAPQPTTHTTNPTVEVNPAPARRLATLRYGEAAIIGFFQTFALLAGISRSGIAMVGGLARGLSHRDAARFSFLLATPVILAAGVLKIPDLTGPLGAGIHGQVLAGSLVSGIGAYLAVRFLVRYFETRTLTPFAIYCTIAGLASALYLGLT
jgi:undecaprenyl-diphosphatase